jgi:hypothetical protein
MLISSYAHEDEGTYALPVRRDTGLPDLPATGITTVKDLKSVIISVRMGRRGPIVTYEFP